MAGLYLEEFEVGRVIRHPITRTVTESDNVLFSVMTMNPQPLHIDFDFAARSEWGRPLVNSLFTLGLMIGISVHETTLGTIVANLGMTDTVFPNPLFHGDTLRVETEILSVREIEVQAGPRHRRVRASGLQAGWHAGRPVHPPGHDAQAPIGDRLTCVRCCSCQATASASSTRRSARPPTRSSSTSRIPSPPRPSRPHAAAPRPSWPRRGPAPRARRSMSASTT